MLDLTTPKKKFFLKEWEGQQGVGQKRQAKKAVLPGDQYSIEECDKALVIGVFVVLHSNVTMHSGDLIAVLEGLLISYPVFAH